MKRVYLCSKYQFVVIFMLCCVYQLFNVFRGFSARRLVERLAAVQISTDSSMFDCCDCFASFSDIGCLIGSPRSVGGADENRDGFHSVRLCSQSSHPPAKTRGSKFHKWLACCDRIGDRVFFMTPVLLRHASQKNIFLLEVANVKLY